MKHFFSKYGFTVLIGVVISILITMVNPLGLQFKDGICGMADNLNSVIDLEKVMDNVGGEEAEDVKTYKLVIGSAVNSKLREIDALNKIKSIEFVDTTMPTSGVTAITGLDADKDDGVVGWYMVDPTDSLTKVYISSQKSGQKVIANADCSNMFNGYISYDNYALNKVEFINLGNLDTSNVLNMNKIFYFVGYNSQSFNTDLSKWNVSNVETMSNMFASAGFNATTWNIGDLSQWNVGNVINMSCMFASAGYNVATFNIGDLSKWNVGKVTKMEEMFSYAGTNADYHLDLSGWDVKNTKTHYSFNTGVESKITPPNWIN